MSGANGSGSGATGQGAPPLQDAALAVLTRGAFEIAGVQRTTMVMDATEKTLITSVENISTDDIDKFVSKIEAVQGTDITNLLASLFDFQGFDPIQIIKRLIAVNQYYRAKTGNTTESEETLKQDIMMMIAANVMMGNLQLKSIGRRSEKGRMALEYLVTKYKMKMGSTGAGMPSTVLTFPRVANSFPVLTCRTANSLPGKTLSMSPFSSKDIPKFMRVSAFASFCHESLEERTRAFLLRVVCAYSCDQSVTVHEGEKKKDKAKYKDSTYLPEDAWAQQWPFAEVSSNSPVPGLAMKRAMMVEFKVAEIFHLLEPVFKKVGEVLHDTFTPVSKAEYELDLQNFIIGKHQAAIQA